MAATCRDKMPDTYYIAYELRSIHISANKLI